MDSNIQISGRNNKTRDDISDDSTISSLDSANNENIEEEDNDIEVKNLMETLQKYDAADDDDDDDDDDFSILEIDGYKCPPEFNNILTPMEFDDIINLYKEYDVNGNNTIDKHEVRKVLLSLNMDSSVENAESLLKLINSNNSGEINFTEFCRFIVMIKQGNEKVRKYKELLDRIKDTPLGQLEHQAKLRNLNLRFVALGERNRLTSNYSTCLTELHISGIWYEVINGKVQEHFAMKVFQGVGKTTREAKYTAATNALIKLGDTMPGIKFKEGIFPDDWLHWIDENLARGVAPQIIAQILSSKGFHPHRNLGLMQRIITWTSFDEFLAKNPDLDILTSSNLNSKFKQWIRNTLDHGIDGEVILRVLFDRSFDLMANHPHYAQKILNNEIGPITDANGKPPELLDFYVACEKGYLDEVMLYCCCRMPVNEEKMLNNSESLRPLTISAMNGHIEIMDILLSNNAEVNAFDRRGRTALHQAAWKGQTKACELLLEHGGLVFQGDYQGNTPLHLAVMANHLETVDFLAFRSQELTRAIAHDMIPVKKGYKFDDLVERLFKEIPLEKLKQSDTQRFEKAWLCDTANKLITLCDKKVQFMLPKTTKEIMEDVLNRFDPRPETGIFLLPPANKPGGKNNQNYIFIPTIKSTVELSILLKHVYHLSSIDSLNKFKRTPLHIACDANQVDSHRAIIELLANKYGSNVFLMDYHHHKPLDLLIMDKNTLNFPSATKTREEVLIENREAELIRYSDEIMTEERELTVQRRQKITDECLFRSESATPKLWEIIRLGSIFKGSYDNWLVYEDPDTKNYFYTKKFVDTTLSNLDINYIEYSWDAPLEFQAYRNYRLGLQYFRMIKSRLLRRIGKWEMYQYYPYNHPFLDPEYNQSGSSAATLLGLSTVPRIEGSSMIFYYNSSKNVFSYPTPSEANWTSLLKESKQLDILGYSDEWEELHDISQNLFYRNTLTGYCQWDKPIDAIKVTAIERFCTAHQRRTNAVNQKLYTCEQCNRLWNTSEHGMRTIIKICEPCIYRCHKLHKGIRLIRTSTAICNCDMVCQVNNLICNACDVSENQITIQHDCKLQQNERLRKANFDELMPPVFAMVPSKHKNGNKKAIYGWMLCRRVATRSLTELSPLYSQHFRIQYGNHLTSSTDDEVDQGQGKVDINNYDDNEETNVNNNTQRQYSTPIPSLNTVNNLAEMNESQSMPISPQIKEQYRKGTIDTIQTIQTIQTARTAVTVETASHSSSMVTISAANSPNASLFSIHGTSNKDKNNKNYGNIDKNSVVNNLDNSFNEASSAFEGNIQKSNSGIKVPNIPSLLTSPSAVSVRTGQISHTKSQLMQPDYPYFTIPALPPGWVQVHDLEEPLILPRFSKVLITMRKRSAGTSGDGFVYYEYGLVKNMVKHGFYSVLYIPKTGLIDEKDIKPFSEVDPDNGNQNDIKMDTKKTDKYAESVDPTFQIGEDGFTEQEFPQTPRDYSFDDPTNFNEMKSNSDKNAAKITKEYFPTLSTMSSVGFEYSIADDIVSNSAFQFPIIDDKLLTFTYVDGDSNSHKSSLIKEGIFYRSSLQLISTNIFCFNTLTGESAWTIPQAIADPFVSQPLSISGNEWDNLYSQSVLRRDFHEWEEVYHQLLDMTFYVHLEKNYKEKCVRTIQRYIRKYFHFAVLFPPSQTIWQSDAYIINPSQDIIKECKELAAWAYLRRRSECKGEFRDIDNILWEEYVDKQTSEFFYYTEESNVYQWDKPTIPDRFAKKLELFEIGQEVLYRFPGKRQEEVAIITNIRYDDETGEDMYDIVHKFVNTLKLKWIPHMELKRLALEGDALLLKRLENAWSRQLKRYRDANARKLKREKDKQLQDEVARLREIKLLEGLNAQQSTKLSENDGDPANIMRGRMMRMVEEEQTVKNEIENTEGLKRKMLVKEKVDEIVAQSQVPFTRADILNLTRAVDIQLRMKEKIEKTALSKRIYKARRDYLTERFNVVLSKLRDHETSVSTPRSLARRDIVRTVHVAERRQVDRMLICEWGCGEWLRIGYDKIDHHNNRCPKRILQCTLGCDLRLNESEWLKNYKVVSSQDMDHIAVSTPHSHVTHKVSEHLSVDGVVGLTYQHFHETEECPKRLLYCPKHCLEWVPAERLDKHLEEECVKRQAKPIYCRLGCNQEFGGSVEMLIQSEDDRIFHEQEECIYRIVRCNWRYEDGKYCTAQVMAKDRDMHRDYHLSLLGVSAFIVPGTYLFKVPSKVTKLKVQLWGAGGGSGFFYNRRGGSGGGGAFIEAIINVEPYEVLEVVVGSGGQGGVRGTEIEFVDLDIQRREMQVKRKKEMYLDKSKRDLVDSVEYTRRLNAATQGRDKRRQTEGTHTAEVIDATCGTSKGGQPGGGDGYGGGGSWASGAGGGYSILSKRTPEGNQALLVAAGGGGGSSLDGLPGSGMDGSLPGTKLDPINGASATCDGPGKCGWCGTILNSKWPASDGAQWQGGNGSEFGAGGGGGYFGGGGGGTTPGIGGAGGGGSSYLFLPRVVDYVLVLGNNHLPGGLKHEPPEAVGIGEWDKVGGIVGQGGIGNPTETFSGNNGGVKIFKPGHY